MHLHGVLLLNTLDLDEFHGLRGLPFPTTFFFFPRYQSGLLAFAHTLYVNEVRRGLTTFDSGYNSKSNLKTIR